MGNWQKSLEADSSTSSISVSLPLSTQRHLHVNRFFVSEEFISFCCLFLQLIILHDIKTIPIETDHEVTNNKQRIRDWSGVQAADVDRDQESCFNANSL